MSQINTVILKKLLSLNTQLTIPDRITQNLMVPFLGEDGLSKLRGTCKEFQAQYKDKHEKVAADTKVAAEMLHCVLNPSEAIQARFLKLLSVPKQDLQGPPLYLIPSFGEEVYFNKDNIRKTKAKRGNITVLEAILRTGNFHLAKVFFSCIPAQEKTEGLKKLIMEIKSKGLCGHPELQAAYKNFIEPFDKLYKEKNWDELDRLSGRLGQAQKEQLCWFSLYLFCHPVTHANADCAKPPHWVCRDWNNKEIDFDSFGLDSVYALYKGPFLSACIPRDAWQRHAAGRSWAGTRLRVLADSAAFTSQCEVLSTEMDKTIAEYGLDEPKPRASVGP